MLIMTAIANTESHPVIFKKSKALVPSTANEHLLLPGENNEKSTAAESQSLHSFSFFLQLQSQTLHLPDCL